jgi:hypothetical protein
MVNTLSINPQFLTDSKGNRISVVLPVKEFEKLMSALEDLEDVRLYDESKADLEPSMPIDEAFKMIEANRVNLRNNIS